MLRNIVTRSISCCTHKFVQYDILLGTIVLNISAIILYHQLCSNRIDGVMASKLTSGVEDYVLDHLSGKDYKISIYCFFSEHADKRGREKNGVG